MQITPPHKNPARRDLTIVSSILDTKAYILPGNRVKCGHGLTYATGGWRLVKPGETPLMFAMGPTDGGGETIQICKAAIVETHVMDMEPGPVSLSLDVSDGGLHFINDPEGLFLAVTKSRVLLA